MQSSICESCLLEIRVNRPLRATGSVTARLLRLVDDPVVDTDPIGVFHMRERYTDAVLRTRLDRRVVHLSYLGVGGERRFGYVDGEWIPVFSRRCRSRQKGRQINKVIFLRLMDIGARLLEEWGAQVIQRRRRVVRRRTLAHGIRRVVGCGGRTIGKGPGRSLRYETTESSDF